MKTRALVCVDSSPLSDWVADEGVDLARATNVQLVLLHVLRSSTPPAPEVLAERAAHVERLIASIRARGIDVVGSVKVCAEPVHEFILREAGREGAKYIVMGSHERTRLYEAFIGSVTTGVIREATVTVVVAPAQRMVAGPG